MSPHGASLAALMAPRSVAIVGASDDPTRIGSRTLALVRAKGFPGPIYPVNPRRDVVQGLTAYGRVNTIPGAVDCAIIAIPADGVLAAVRDCAAKGVGAAIIFSAGFAEAPDPGPRLQAELTAIARAGGVRLLGPNCTGAYNLRTGAYLSFYDAGVTKLTPGRNIGIVSQSGGYGAHVVNLARARDLSVGHWVTTGNESDIEIGEVLGQFAGDPDVDVIVGYIEGVRSPGPFLAALRLARANRKPVILMKSGRTERGARAAASHTASLAGTDAAYDAVFREFGVHRARTTEEVLDVAYAALGGRLPRDRRLGVMTNSGGMGVQIADDAERFGLELPSLGEAGEAAVLTLVPNGSALNPVDFTAQWLAEPHLISGCMEVLLGPCGFEAVLCFMGTSGSNPVVFDAVASVLARHPGRLVVMCVVVPADVARRFEAIGCLVFEEPARAIGAIAALAVMARGFVTDTVVARDDVAPIIPADLRMNEREARRILAACGIAGPREQVVATPDEAAVAATAIGFPVVVKILSADITHKTDVGGVVLDLRDAASVVAAGREILDRVAVVRPDATIDGLLVTAMDTRGLECIIGAHRDPLFGPLVMVGTGGIGVELFRDVAWRRAPVDVAAARGMIGELKLAVLLDGFRGRPKLDVDALLAAIVAISRLAASHAAHVRTIEVNPILVRPEGQGVIALDAVIEVDQPST